MPLLIVRSTINTEWGEGIRDKTSRIDNVNRNGLTPQFRREFKVFLVVSTLHKVLCQQHQEKPQSNMPQRTKWYKMVHSAQWKKTMHYTNNIHWKARLWCKTIRWVWNGIQESDAQCKMTVERCRNNTHWKRRSGRRFCCYLAAAVILRLMMIFLGKTINLVTVTVCW